MRLPVISIGSSKGIRIPKAIPDKYPIKNMVDVVLVILNLALGVEVEKHVPAPYTH